MARLIGLANSPLTEIPKRTRPNPVDIPEVQGLTSSFHALDLPHLGHLAGILLIGSLPLSFWKNGHLDKEPRRARAHVE
jgi:hypothetical protein